MACVICRMMYGGCCEDVYCLLLLRVSCVMVGGMLVVGWVVYGGCCVSSGACCMLYMAVCVVYVI